MAVEDVVVEPMSLDCLYWRCLHGGPLTRASLDQWEPSSRVPWARLRSRNVPLLRRLTETYGACAILARDGDRVVGQLRFYPKALYGLERAGGLCLQQLWPGGPREDFGSMELPPPETLPDRTLVVSCMMTGSPSQAENPYQRKGLGSRMVRALIEWAAERRWEAIEATAYEDLGLVYEVTGQAGKSFWLKLGFRIVKVGVEPAFVEDGDFARVLMGQAAAQGLAPEVAQRRYTLRLELPSR